jgi:type I restriction enzyme S subunit
MNCTKTDWTSHRLGEVATVFSGFAFKSKEFGTSGIPVVKISNVRDRYIDLTDAAYVSDNYLSLDSKYHLRYGDILISLTGSHLSQPNSVVGRVARFTYRGLPCLLNQRAGKISVDKIDKCDTGFLFYLLCTPGKRHEIALKAHGAANQANVSPSQVESIEVILPSVETQRKITGVLSAYDDLIDNNTRRIAILEEIAQAIYREWFVHFRFPGHDDVKLVKSPLGKIPEGWKPCRLGDLAEEVRRGVDPSSVDPETPYFGLEHLPRRSITLDDWGRAKDVQSTKLAFKQGEILFGKIRPYFHKVGVAPVDGVCSSDAIVIVPNSESSFGPVVCCVSSDDFVRHATQTSQGTKMPRANWDVLVKYPLPLPPDDLLAEFNKIISDVVANLRLLMFKNRNLRATRDLLLPKLIDGQLNVEELEIETESTLVEAVA